MEADADPHPDWQMGIGVGRRDDSDEGHGIIPSILDSDCLQIGWGCGGGGPASIHPHVRFVSPSHLTPDGACTAPVKNRRGSEGENERKWGWMDRLSLTCDLPPFIS